MSASTDPLPTAELQRRVPHATWDGDRHTCWSGQLELQELQIMARVLDGLRRL